MNKTPLNKQPKNSVAVFVLWQSLVVGGYRSFFVKLAAYTPWRLALAAPREFRELGRQRVACEPFQVPFSTDQLNRLRVFVLRSINIHIQIVLFRGLGLSLRNFFQSRPRERRVFICLAEPYSPTAFLAWLTARLVLGRTFDFYCYGLQNIFKNLALPLRVIQKILFTQVKGILVAGEEHAEVLRQHGYKGPMLLFPLWYDSARFRFTEKTSGKWAIGFAGSLVTEKGVLDLIACCKKLRSNLIAECVLHIAGSGPLASEITARAEELRKIGWTVIIHGPLGASAMPTFFGDLDLLVVPSLTCANWKEQFGRVIVEAEACGVIALGSDSGEIPHVIGDPSRIFPEGNIPAMQQVIEKWLGHLSDRGRQRLRPEQALTAKRYSDEVCAAKFAALLSSTDL